MPSRQDTISLANIIMAFNKRLSKTWHNRILFYRKSIFKRSASSSIAHRRHLFSNLYMQNRDTYLEIWLQLSPHYLVLVSQLLELLGCSSLLEQRHTKNHHLRVILILNRTLPKQRRCLCLEPLNKKEKIHSILDFEMKITMIILSISISALLATQLRNRKWRLVLKGFHFTQLWNLIRVYGNA